jgi:hypothetical protein
VQALLDLVAVCLWCLVLVLLVSLVVCVCPVVAALVADRVPLCWNLARQKAAKAAMSLSASVLAMSAAVAT